ncbi:MAG: precorrin-6y C5,15-methyltransferase (decarboxylating) subunit CbiE [Omnitrophica bacterium]|nr:precorrin-6y C5,15-methyltransferase (decarboxylating) subunit CbiE [Candidatus Omnitrophota bacterium]
MNKVHIIGVGPGTMDYLLPIAKREIQNADCLIGAERLLGLFADLNKEKIRLEGHFTDVIPYIKENRDKKKIIVLVSGDPGLYSFLGQLSKVLSKEEYVVIPGISAVQMAFSRIGENWQDAEVISLHGRKFDNLAKEVKNYAKIFIFTDSKSSPEKIAANLLEEGVENRRAIVFENLAYANERIIDSDLKNLSKMKGFGLCVVIIKK